MISDLTQCKRLLLAVDVPCRAGEPLCNHTSFHIGGAATIFCSPQTTHQLAASISACRQTGTPYYLLGRGSNTLFADEGYPGTVIFVSEALGEIHVSGCEITAGAGASLGKICTAALDAGLTGMEFAYGIPGSLGGAVYMNAGAYGGEMKDILVTVNYLDENGKECSADAATLDFGYRHSSFCENPWCILGAKICLKPGEKNIIRKQMDSLMARRKEKQPLEFPSAGSTFKRPTGAYAGALIEQCGLRGYRVGDAAISEKHCGFVINLGKASCSDVIRLTQEVHDRVLEQTGYELEREIRVVR